MRHLTLDLLGKKAAGSARRVLDVGCGTGLFLAECLASGVRESGVGVDAHLEALAYARQCSNEHVVAASAAALPFLPETFDIIHCADVLQHMTLAESRQALCRFADLLKPGGCLALRLRARRLFRNSPDTNFSHSFRRSGIRQTLERLGLRVVFLSHVNLLPSLATDIAGLVRRPTDDAPVKGIHLRQTADIRSRVLGSYLALERAWLVRTDIALPAGHTLLCVARKDT